MDFISAKAIIKCENFFFILFSFGPFVFIIHCLAGAAAAAVHRPTHFRVCHLLSITVFGTGAWPIKCVIVCVVVGVCVCVRW